MKSFLIALALSLALFTQPAKAASYSAQTVRVLFSAATLTASTYTELIASTARAVRSISVFNNSVNPIVIAVGAAGSEVDHLIVPAGGSLAYNLPVINGLDHQYPLTTAPLRRISMRAKNSSVVNGEFIFNAFY